MKKVLFSVIALTALGMTQAHAETHDKTAEFSVTEKAHADPNRFGGGYGGGRGGNSLSGGTTGGGGGGGGGRGFNLSRGGFESERQKLLDKFQNNTIIDRKDTQRDNNDKGQDRNRCGCGCGGGGGGNNLDQRFEREWHR